MSIDISAHELMQTCLQENEQRMAGYDPRLRLPLPAIVPFSARLACQLLPARR